MPKVTDKLQDRMSYPPRGMRADRAAAYLGMSRTEFLKLVDDNKMPKPTKVAGMSIWDRLELDLAFEEWRDRSDTESQNPFDEALRVKK